MDDMPAVSQIAGVGGAPGQGGQLNSAQVGGGGGGGGGNATLNVAGALSAGTLTMTSGLKGAGDGGGAGGGAYLTATALSAQTVTLTRNGGALGFNVGSLDVTAGNTAFTLSGASAASEVVIGMVNLGAGRTLTTDIAAGSGYTLNGLNVLGGGATLAKAGGGQSLDLSGKAISFDLTGATVGVPVLTAGGDLVISSSTGVTLLNAPGTLTVGDAIVLVDAVDAASSFTALDVVSGRYRFSLGLAGGNAFAATFGGVNSFEDAVTQLVVGGTTEPMHPNIISGGRNLDRIINRPGVTRGQATALTSAFDNSLALGGGAAVVALEQLFGGSAVYANTPVQTTGGAMQAYGNGQNRTFLDTMVFSDRLTLSQGVASNAAHASVPVYGTRRAVPAGRSRIWAEGFGSWAKQDAEGGFAGYKYDAQGAVLGYEYRLDCFNLGVAAAYSRGDMKVDTLGYRNKPDILNLALYSSYVHESGFYAQGGLGYGHAWNDYTVNMLVGGQKKGKYGSNDYSANLELGYVARLPKDFNLIPSVGIVYDYLQNNGWTESVSTPALVANRFERGHDNSLGIPVGLRFNKLFRFGACGYVIPEVRAAWTYQADTAGPFVNAGFANVPDSANLTGISPGRSHWRVGAGVSGRFNERVDFRVDYDFDVRSGYRGHNVMAVLGVSF